MMSMGMRSDADIEEAIDLYGDTVLRASMSYLSSHHDAEDVFQDTFIKYATCTVNFNDETHRKAWLIRVAINICKDRLRAASTRAVPLDEYDGTETDPGVEGFADSLRVRQAMRQLTEDQRIALMLSVVEGYTVPEIAEAMDRPQNTVYSYITRGKRKLEKVLGDD